MCRYKRITEPRLREIGFKGNDLNMWIDLPLGKDLQLHLDGVVEGEFEKICISQGRTDDKIPMIDYTYFFLKEVTYMHELQNVFFTLTGIRLA